MKYWIKLTRPVNLLIIALTMYLTHWTIWKNLNSDQIYPLWKFHFVVLVMVCLAAAGNIINDYFDLRVDRINKPEKVLIGKHVKRRVAMLSHQFLNGFAVLTGFWLAYDVGNLWLGLTPIFIATTLWVYSVVLKKKVLIGNLAVALLIALVPLYSGAFDFLTFSESSFTDTLFDDVFTQVFGSIVTLFIILSFAVFGFLLTLIREAQKDLEDLNGDTKVGYQTMPIRFGIAKTKNYLTFLFFITILALISSLYIFTSTFEKHVFFNGFVTISTLSPLLKSWWLTIKAKEKNDFQKAGNYTKIAMVLGMFFLVYLWYSASII